MLTYIAGIKKELAMLINDTFYDFIHDPHADALFFSVRGFFGDILPAAADIYGFSVSGMCR